MIKFPWDQLMLEVMRTNKYFYSHLVDLRSIEDELASLDLTKQEKKELLEIAHMNLHGTILDAILSELNEKDKRHFLTLVANGEDEKIWEHLNAKVEKLEEKIRDASEQIKKELKKDIAKVKT